MMSRLALSLAFVCSLATVSLLSKQVNAGNDLQFGTVTYKTARIVVPRDYDSVIESFKASLSTFNIAKAYALYDAGATREQFIQGVASPIPRDCLTSFTKSAGSCRSSLILVSACRSIDSDSELGAASPAASWSANIRRAVSICRLISTSLLMGSSGPLSMSCCLQENMQPAFQRNRDIKNWLESPMNGGWHF